MFNVTKTNALDKKYLALLPLVTFPSMWTCSPSSEWIGIQISLAYHFKDRFMPFHYGHDCHFEYMARVKSTPPFRDGTLLTSNVSFSLIIIQQMQLGFFWHACTLTALYWLIPVIQYLWPFFKDLFHLFLVKSPCNLGQNSLKINILTKYDSQMHNVLMLMRILTGFSGVNWMWIA